MKRKIRIALAIIDILALLSIFAVLEFSLPDVIAGWILVIGSLYALCVTTYLCIVSKKMKELFSCILELFFWG